MNDRDVETIIQIVVGLVVLGIILVPLLAFVVYVFVLSGARKRIVQRTVKTHQQLIGNKRWLPARYASEARFKSWFKIFPWEGAGILVMAPGSVLFLGAVRKNPLTLQFAPGNATVQWLGKCPWPNGAVSWFQFTTADQKHYFSSETGAFIFGSNRGTKELFDESSRSFTDTVGS